ncbi:Egg cell-secreted protein 1.4 [Bienertia sinuspersici]
MALKSILFMFLAIAFLMPNATTSSRNLPNNVINNPRVLDLVTRLQVNKDGTNAPTTDCWTSLAELKTCSNEIIGFFLNGYTDIDTPCCQAIEVIIHHCWPSMLSVLGFTTEEGDLLAAYCSNESSSSPAPVGSPPDAVTDTVGSHF